MHSVQQHKIDKALVDDIDFFKFPKQYLLNEIDKYSESKGMSANNRKRESKEDMIRVLVDYARLYKKGLCKFPAAISLLDTKRMDLFELN